MSALVEEFALYLGLECVSLLSCGDSASEQELAVPAKPGLKRWR